MALLHGSPIHAAQPTGPSLEGGKVLILKQLAPQRGASALETVSVSQSHVQMFRS